MNDETPQGTLKILSREPNCLLLDMSWVVLYFGCLVFIAVSTTQVDPLCQSFALPNVLRSLCLAQHVHSGLAEIELAALRDRKGEEESVAL